MEIKTATIVIHNTALIKANGHHTHGNSRSVYSLENGNRYVSALDASEITGINHANITSVCRKVKSMKTAGGLRWRYVSNMVDDADEIFDHIAKQATEIDHLRTKNAMLDERLRMKEAELESLRNQQNTEVETLRRKLAAITAILNGKEEWK